jgi:hypothetical protein
MSKYLVLTNLLKLGGDNQAEKELVEHFNASELLHDHLLPIITNIVRVAEDKGYTIAALLLVVLTYMQLDPTRSLASTSNSASKPSLMEHTCNAMTLFLLSSETGFKSLEAGGSGRCKPLTV